MMRPLIGLALAVGASLLLYAQGLSGGFVFDDIPLLVQNDCHRSLAGLARAFDFASGHTCTIRPVRFVSFAADHAVWGQDPFGFKLTNAILHGLVAGLFGWLLLRITGRRALALAAAALFVVHPIATEAVTYISGRRDLLAALFGLALAHLWWTARARPRGWQLSLMALALLLALGSYEGAAAFPVVLVLLEFYLGADGVAGLRRLRDRRVWVPLGALFVLTVAFTIWTLGQRNFSQQQGLWGGSLAAHMGTVLHGHLHYLHQQLWPVALQADYSPAGFPIAAGLGDPPVLLASLVLCVGTLVATVGRRRLPHVALAVAAYAALLLPSSQVVPHHELLAEHRLYLASGLVCALVAAAMLAGLGRLHRLAPPVGLALLVLLLAALTWARVPDWHDEESLWTATLAVAPQSARAHANLAAIRAEQGRPDAAYAHLKVATAVRPDLCPAWFNLGMLRRGHPEGAAALRRAWACDPKPRWRGPIERVLGPLPEGG